MVIGRGLQRYGLTANAALRIELELLDPILQLLFLCFRIGEAQLRETMVVCEKPLSEMDDDEADRLDMAADLQLNSRLGCQAVITKPGKVVVEIPSWNRNYVSEEH